MSISFCIPLTKGKFALVDPHDFFEVSQYKWTLKETRFNKYAYRQYKQEGKMVQILLHRFISKCPTGLAVDHKNGNGLDNRRVNLRVCTQSENLANTSRHSDRKYDLPKGVGYKADRKTNPYYSQITKGGKRYNLGYFSTVDAAYAAYKQKSIELFGEFSRC